MYKHRFWIILLTLSLLLGTPTYTAYAEESTDSTAETSEENTYLETIHISTAEDLLTLADSCRLDTWSLDRLIVLEADIDLTDTEFSGIPTFGGTFEGNDFTIRGLSITKEGNTQGLFRYLQSTAIVQNLNVEGEIHPDGTSSTLGGLAGSNAGQILNCTFNGSVSGADRIGGLVGSNEVTGILDDCKVSGTIQGSHFTGGLAGQNRGVIRSCTNYAEINTSASHNSITLEDITLDNLTNSEAAYTATDMGGMAGTSSGVIRDCTNYGNIGYQSMSYNAGGIAGSLTGYLVDCENHGVIYARKDVGGIVGQLEPSNVIEYDEDTLQILTAQIDSLGNLADRTQSHANSSSHQINSQLGVLHNQSQATQDALGQILRETDSPSDLLDPDTRLAVRNTLTSSLNEMSGTMEGLNNSLTVTTTTLINDIQALTKQLQRISSTLNNAEENLGATVTDISDLDTEEDTISKIFSSTNHGEVHADQNGGGIVGTIGLENDLDPEDDVDIRGDLSMNLSYETRAVTRDCHNHGIVSVKKSNAGGIVGIMTTGAVLDCVNLGRLDAENADQVGGIAGSSSAIIRRCDAKCTITGQSQVGGIAGIGSTVTECRGLTHIQANGPEIGTILGSSDRAMSLQVALTEEERAVAKNYYLAAGPDLGAVDGISYSGCAEPLSLTDFLAIEELPEYFTTMTITFVSEDQDDITFQIPVGDSFPMDQIPAVPLQDKHDGEWQGLAQADLSSIWFDQSFTAVYEAYHQTLQSSDVRDNGLPVLLAEGAFPTDSSLHIEITVKAPTISEDSTLLESWLLTTDAESSLTVHYQPEESLLESLDRIHIYVQDDLGAWTKRETSIDGRYLVFAMAEDEDTFCAVQIPVDYTPYYLAACGAGILIITILIVIVIKKMRRSRVKSTAESPANEHEATA